MRIVRRVEHVRPHVGRRSGQELLLDAVARAGVVRQDLAWCELPALARLAPPADAYLVVAPKERFRVEELDHAPRLFGEDLDGLGLAQADGGLVANAGLRVVEAHGEAISLFGPTAWEQFDHWSGVFYVVLARPRLHAESGIAHRLEVLAFDEHASV